jgi:hypothetical protein
VSSCFLVVFIFSLLHTMVYYTPLTTLQEAESAGGQFDLSLTPKVVHGQANGIMYGSLKDTMMNNGFDLKFNRSTGRLSVSALLILSDNPDLNVSVELQLINSANEKSMGLGRTWPLPACPANKIYIRKEAAERLNGEDVDLVMNESFVTRGDFIGSQVTLQLGGDAWGELGQRFMYVDDYTHLTLSDWNANDTLKGVQLVEGLEVGAIFGNNAGKVHVLCPPMHQRLTEDSAS